MHYGKCYDAQPFLTLVCDLLQDGFAMVLGGVLTSLFSFFPPHSAVHLIPQAILWETFPSLKWP